MRGLGQGEREAVRENKGEGKADEKFTVSSGFRIPEAVLGEF